MPARMLVSNGQVVSTTDVITADVLIEGRSVIGVVAPQSVAWEDAYQIDATGKYVLPGLVDPHTHIQLDTGIFQTADNWEIGTKVAAYGGVTTVVDFATQFPGQNFEEALDNRLQEAAPAYIDYAFHMMVTDPPSSDTAYRQALEELRDMGVPSIKLYTTYRPNYYMDDGALYRSFGLLPEDMLALIHCENDAMIATATQHLLDQQHTRWLYHAQSRPMQAEVEAVARVVHLAELAKANVYIVHCSHVQTVLNLRDRRRALMHSNPEHAVFFETCPQYFVLDDHVYAGASPEKFILQPPLRDTHSVEQMRQAALAVDVISTDHCDYTYAQKTEFETFTKTPGGLPGLETSLALTFSFLAAPDPDEKIKYIAQKMAATPAQIFGLYPRKGALLAGSDADVVIFDPHVESTIWQANLHTIGGYSPYEGLGVRGQVETTISKGKIVMHRGEFWGEMGRGEFVKGKPLQR